MLYIKQKDETMKLQLLPIEQELAAITERFQKHFDGNKQDIDLLESEVEAIKLQLEEIQNVTLKQFEKPLRSPTKVRSDAERSKKWSFGDIGEMVDELKGKVEEKFSKTSPKQDKPKEQVLFESLKELLETQLAQKRLYTISQKRTSSQESRDSGFSSSLTNKTFLPTGFSSQSSFISTSSSDTSPELTYPLHTSTIASVNNQTENRPEMLSEVEIGPPTVPGISLTDLTHSTPLFSASAFQDISELISLRFDAFLSDLLTIVDSYLGQK